MHLTPPPQWARNTPYYCHACRRLYQERLMLIPKCNTCEGSHVELVENRHQMIELVGLAQTVAFERDQAATPRRRRVPMPREEAPYWEIALRSLVPFTGDIEPDQELRQMRLRILSGCPTPTHVIAALPTFERLTAQHLSSNPLLSNPCAVCWDGLEGEEEERACGAVMVLPCKHGFHRDCLVPWLQNARTCPQCRLLITNEME